ncbi:hypothetical protein SFRURICE_021499, partial [Spodoptera frugiperda]
KLPRWSSDCKCDCRFRVRFPGREKYYWASFGISKISQWYGNKYELDSHGSDKTIYPVYGNGLTPYYLGLITQMVKIVAWSLELCPVYGNRLTPYYIVLRHYMS